MLHTRHRPRVRLRALACPILVAAVILPATRAEAIPAFARKYKTSCQTCHIVFPKLNAFGEAFRLNGYRMPSETEDMVKEIPVPLGAPAYKRLWPKAIWPGSISPSVPLAVNIKMADVNTSAVNDQGGVDSVKNDFQFPQELNIFGAGTLGDTVSYFSEVTFGQEPDGSVTVELEHAHIGFDSPFGRPNLFHFRIGEIAPNVVDGFQEMWIMTDAGIDSLFAYNPVGVNGGTGLAEEGGGISLPALGTGIEAYGIVQHRMLYVAGLINGIGDPTGNRFDGNNAKDVYARFDYKLGGMGLDGDLGGKNPPAENWRDDSLRMGVFVYRGDGSGIPFDQTDAGDVASIQDQHYLRTGFYASAFVRDLNVFGVYMHGTDTLQRFDADGLLLSQISPSYHAWFTEADYVFYPWLQGAFRYETVTPADPAVLSLRTAVFNASALIRANVKAMVEYQRDLREGRNHSLNALVRFAF
jgi:hypothetical protein